MKTNNLAGLSKAGNLYIARKHFHIKYLGNYELLSDQFPVQVKHLAFCYHANEDITYCVLAAEIAISPIKLWRNLITILQCQFGWEEKLLENEYTCPCLEIELSSHWETIFHHHIGLKTNPEICTSPGIQWKTPQPYQDVDKYRNYVISRRNSRLKQEEDSNNK